MSSVVLPHRTEPSTRLEAVARPALTLARWVTVKSFTEARGSLNAIDFSQLPFVPCRAFYVTDVPAGTVRGGHAHRQTSQLLYCLSGRIEVELRRDGRSETAVCDPASGGLLIRPGTWARQTYLEPVSTLLVLCSHPYHPESYVHAVS